METTTEIREAHARAAETKPQWHYIATNLDKDRPATTTEITWIGWPQPESTDKEIGGMVGEVPDYLDELIKGNSGSLNLMIVATSGETISIEIEF